MFNKVQRSKPEWLRKIGKLLDQPLGNGLWFYALWLSAIGGREQWLPVTAALLLIHLISVDDSAAELRAAITLATIGATLDSLLSLSGFFIFEGYTLAPPWLICVWFGFAVCLHRSMRYFAKHPLVMVVFGGVGGGFSYWGGMKLGAVSFGVDEGLAVTVLVVLWAFIFPASVLINRRLRNLSAEVEEV